MDTQKLDDDLLFDVVWVIKINNNIKNKWKVKFQNMMSHKFKKESCSLRRLFNLKNHVEFAV